MPYGLKKLRDMEDLVNYNSDHADCIKHADEGIFMVAGYVQKIACQVTTLALENYAGFAVKMKKQFPGCVTECRELPNKIADELLQLPNRELKITDADAWSYLKDLCNVTITCYSADEVTKAYEDLKGHKMIKRIMKVVPHFDSDSNEVIVYFDYFFVIIAAARIRLMDPPAMRIPETFVKEIEDSLKIKDRPMIFNIFKRRQRDLVDRDEMGQ